MPKLFENSNQGNISENFQEPQRKTFLETPRSIKWFLIIISLLGIFSILETLSHPKLNFLWITSLVISIFIVILQFYIALNISKVIHNKFKWVIPFFWIRFALALILTLPVIFVNKKVFLFQGIFLIIDLVITIVLVRSFRRFFK